MSATPNFSEDVLSSPIDQHDIHRDIHVLWAGSWDGIVDWDPDTLLPRTITILSRTYYEFPGGQPMPHWLDHAIATLEKEAARWRHSDGDKAESHATAAAVLTKLAESGVSHDEVKTQLLAGSDETEQEGSQEGGEQSEGDPRFPRGGVTADVHVPENTPPA